MFAEDPEDPIERAAIAAALGLIASGGLAGLGLLENRLDRKEKLPVVEDEYGNSLKANDDGLYPWEVDGVTTYVDLEEVQRLIAEAAAYKELNERRSKSTEADIQEWYEKQWETYGERSKQRAADEVAHYAAAKAKREAELERGFRLREVIEDHTGNPVFDKMLDRLETDPWASDEEFIAIRRILAQQLGDQQAIDALGDKGVWRIAAEGMQEDLAALLEKALPPVMGYPAGWIVRNPAMVARFAGAYFTGGATEIILMPMDLYSSLNAAADAKRAATNEDLTTGEILWEGAKYAAWEWTIGKVSQAGFKRLFKPKTLHMPPAKNMVLRRLRPGEVIPDAHLWQTGYTRQHMKELAAFAKKYKVKVTARTTNPYSLAHLRRGAHPKPLGIKAKTVTDIDVFLGASKANRGTVGLFKPKMPDTSGMTDDLADAVRKRYAVRAKEFAGRGKYAADPNFRIKDGQILNAKTGKPYAGDMDMVKIEKGGKLVTGDDYLKFRKELEDLSLAEHGAESQVIADMTRDLDYSADPNAYYDKFKEAWDLQGNLEGAHLDASEISVSFGDDGLVRIADQIDSLPHGY